MLLLKGNDGMNLCIIIASTAVVMISILKNE